MKIVIEGCDKIGKTTQVNLLLTKLDAVKLKLPNEESHSGKILRQILDGDLKYEANSFQALMVIDKMLAGDHIKKLSKENEYVIFDRWCQSGDIYGYLEGVDETFMRNMNELLEPNTVVIVLHGKPYAQDNDIYGDKDFQVKVNERYIELAKKNNWILINGNQTIEEVHNAIIDAIDDIHPVYLYDNITPNMVMDSIKDCYAQHTVDSGFNPSAIFVENSLYEVIRSAWQKKNFLVPVLPLITKKGSIIAIGGGEDEIVHETIICLNKEE